MKFPRFKDLDMSYKFVVLIAIVIVVFSCAMFQTYTQTSAVYHERSDIMHEEFVTSGYQLIEHFSQLEKSGQLSRQDAQTLAKEAIRQLRYEKVQYLWIQDEDARIIMHPISPELENGKPQYTTDLNGIQIFVEAARASKTESSRFEYQWRNTHNNQTANKLAYVKRFKDWNWIIASGSDLQVDIENMASIRAHLLYSSGIALSILILICVFISKSISKPLVKITEHLNRIGKGKFEKRLEFFQYDEIGEMSKTIDDMTDNLQAHGDAAMKIADGDLSVKIKIASTDDLLGNALQTMVENLRQTISQIQTSSNEVSSASEQVASSSQQMSQNTVETAASLEEINSSLTEIASQIQTTAGNAKQAESLVLQTLELANHGQEQVHKVVSAISMVTEASHDTQQIIKTIDEIAFQTNLLALNAAVEAARAGQHGRGFAVVAEEVRNLATRSANAAKKTEELINSTVERAENGTKLASTAEQRLTEIHTAVSKVSSLVTEISETSFEQSSGIEQIRLGLTQVDNSAQHNTATAEETAAAAEELSSQAVIVNHELSKFHIA
jgi:methyl-accepting chemotaxis protein